VRPRPAWQCTASFAPSAAAAAMSCARAAPPSLRSPRAAGARRQQAPRAAGLLRLCDRLVHSARFACPRPMPGRDLRNPRGAPCACTTSGVRGSAVVNPRDGPRACTTSGMRSSVDIILKGRAARLHDLQHAQQRGHAHVAPADRRDLHARRRKRAGLVREPAREYAAPAVRVLARLRARAVRMCGRRPPAPCAAHQPPRPCASAVLVRPVFVFVKQALAFKRMFARSVQDSLLRVAPSAPAPHHARLPPPRAAPASTLALQAPTKLAVHALRAGQRASCRLTTSRTPAAARAAGRLCASRLACHGRAMASTPGVTQLACRPGYARSAAGWAAGSSSGHDAPPARF